MISLLGALLLQQAVFTGNTSPPSGDTTGYWQQRVAYTIVAHLDEGLQAITADGELKYVNNSPDTLREMYFHQYLNAFKPGSKWSASDDHENRERFQHLREPDYGYERFKAAPIVGGVPTLVDYPGSPDSTVVHLRLPHPLAPHDSVVIQFKWEARPSVVPRRQARKGRSYDFAQWYPKVAVYDRGGWEPNAFIPAGELYGEFGTYDVTLVVRDDQVLGATGVPVSGDPGWDRVSKTGAPWIAKSAYPALPHLPTIVPARGERAVRFYAENVHHFAWTASPDYIYEGGVYVRPDTTRRHFTTFDTVGVNVLYRPGPADDTTWAGGRALQRTISALKWLENLYGPYAYPAVTNVHRIDGGGTEFPMMVMNGSASPGLILHEFGHVFTYGILANNEWRSAWLDEGLTEYQSRWAQKLTPQDNQRGEIVRDIPVIPSGYRANATTIAKPDSADFDELRIELMGRSEPVGRSAPDFREFAIYNKMVYDRAAIMYGHLRDLMGDSVFVAFTRDYYDHWAFKHVDERAIRASAERAYGANLGWFFDQWLRGTGLLNYGAGEHATTEGNGKFVTRVRVSKYGELRHPMPVGIHTAAGWTIGRSKVELDDQWVDITTDAAPDSIELDPYHTTWDWDWRDNTEQPWVGTVHAPDVVLDWPFLNQSNRSRTLVAYMPRVWFSQPQGVMIGMGVRTNYLGMTDIHEALFGFATRGPVNSRFGTQFQLRARADDVYLSPFMSRPAIGTGVGLAFMDGIVKADLSHRWDLSPFIGTNGPRIATSIGLTGAYPLERNLLPEQWSNAHVIELMASGTYKAMPRPDSQTVVLSAHGGVGYANGRDATFKARPYARLLLSAEGTRYLAPGQQAITVRLNAGIANDAPLQRAIYAASADPWETFDNDYFRPRSAAFKETSFALVPVGGGALRGASYLVATDRIVSANVDLTQKLLSWGPPAKRLTLWAGPYADGALVHVSPLSAVGATDHLFADGGIVVALRGRIFDRDVKFRLGIPIAVNTHLAGATAPGRPLYPWSVQW